MTHTSGTQPVANRIERIGREIKDLRDRGYSCRLQRDRQSSIYCVIVQAKRDSEEIPQPATVYLLLDADFPQSHPELVVTLQTLDTNMTAEIEEMQVDADSQERRFWTSDSRLYQIVEEVEIDLMRENLKPVDKPVRLPTTGVASGWRSWLAISGNLALTLGALAAVVFAVIVFAAYYAFFRDPCAADWNRAQQNLAATDPVAQKIGLDLLEQLYKRGLQGERGRCALLKNDTTPLYQAYQLIGQQLLADGKLGDAKLYFQRMRGLARNTEQKQAADQGLDAVEAALLRPQWDQIEGLRSANLLLDWAQIVEKLKDIRAADANAIDPVQHISVTLSLYKTYIGWGDELYAQGQYDAAHDRYTKASDLGAFDPPASDRVAWANRGKRLSEADGQADWSGLLQELEQLRRQKPQPLAPDGNTIDYLLYDTHVKYGKVLLDQGGTITETVSQVNAALELAGASDDNGKAALELKQQVDALQSANNTYHLEVETPGDVDWRRILKEQGLVKTSNGRPINLIVINQYNNTVTVTLIRAGAQQAQKLGFAGNTVSGNNVASESIEDRYAILHLVYGDEIDDTVLDFTKPTNYLIRVLPQ